MPEPNDISRAGDAEISGHVLEAARHWQVALCALRTGVQYGYFVETAPTTFLPIPRLSPA